MPTSLARVRISAEPHDARDIVAVLAAVAGSAPPPADAEPATVTVGTTEIEVAVGTPAAPAVIEFRTDRPLDQVLADLLDAHGSASTSPSDPDSQIETVTAHVGKVTVKVTADVALVPFLMDRLGRAEIAGDRVEAAFWRGSLRRVRKVQGEMARLQEQVLALVPERERGAISAMALSEGMKWLQAAVYEAVAEAKRVSDEIHRQEQAHRRDREAGRG